ncbi:MAG: hypothetical protein KKE08_19555 [Gammaproteobacteria bacterium]|nr:hypothetical protein [Gammaproteobacteria bacterium]MBU2185226.1 hypothetical protein [Gammaproteobacteria bacterium]MBU2206287.1 hypothetical protein [Gammaproteobacteria bacterium]
MRAINPPNISLNDVLNTCIGSISSDELSTKLNAIIPSLMFAERDYIIKVATSDLFQIPAFTRGDHAIVTGNVTKKELKDLYSSHMVPASKPARVYYDQIKMLAPLSICPFCGFGHVTTLDHYLPKAKYPLLSVLPNNLVASCTDCNKGKNDETASTKQQQCLHPYYDQGHYILEQWLYAEVEESSPASLKFNVNPPAHWSHDDKVRIQTHFTSFKLANRFRVQAATELPVLKGELEYDFTSAHTNGVRQALQRKFFAASSQHVNWWKSAMYQALANSDWYCSGGFR